MMATAAPHVPVMLDRVTDLLATAPDGVVVDGTVGAGGHAGAVLRARVSRHGSARLVGIDRDPVALELARERLDVPGADVDLVRARFDRMGDVLDERGIGRVAGVLLDLGLSSMQLDHAERGFSYRSEGPLDMRMDPDGVLTASDVVNTWTASDIARVLRHHGDERFADRIAHAVVAARPITSTTDLAEVVRDAIPAATRRTGGHPATRTFQALRIAVNDELEALDGVLDMVVDRLVEGGVAVVLSYHSLEDRRVKQAFVRAARGCICPVGLAVCACGRSPRVEHLVRRPERPGDAEVAENSRARSALLRAVRRLEVGP
ncbi:MAG: 16S rRNA (cytosine(1402)-N(4))-methyltransferase RsmH [Nitriliruptoraceae bacterium]